MIAGRTLLVTKVLHHKADGVTVVFKGHYCLFMMDYEIRLYPLSMNEDLVQREAENHIIHRVSPHRYSLHFLVQSGLSYSVMVFAGLENMHK